MTCLMLGECGVVAHKRKAAAGAETKERWQHCYSNYAARLLHFTGIAQPQQGEQK